MRAEFAVSILRLETVVREEQAKAAGQHRDVARRLAEIQRLKVELRRTNLIILRFQARELMLRSATRTIVKLVVYLFERSHRQSSPARRLLGRKRLLAHVPDKWTPIFR